MKTQLCKSIHACLTEIGVYCDNQTLDSKLLMLDIHFNYLCAVYIYIYIYIYIYNVCRNAGGTCISPWYSGTDDRNVILFVSLCCIFEGTVDHLRFNINAKH
jgi:hypothetical protein